MLGGAPDAIARMVAEKLQAAWGQPVIVENKPAAGGTLMSQEVASAAPDGHTLMFCSSGQIMVVPFYKVSYDMVRDFAGITQITTMPWVLAVTPSLPVASVQELVALAKQKPGVLNFASSGLGTPPHLVGEMLARRDRRRHGACALQDGGAGDIGSRRRPCAGDVHRGDRRHAADRRRLGAPARGDHREALALPAGPARP